MADGRGGLSASYVLDSKILAKEHGKRTSVHQAELDHELNCVLQSIGLLQKDVQELHQNVSWHHLEQKWANQVTQVGEEMQRVIQQVKGDSDKLDEVVRKLQLRETKLESQLSCLEAEAQGRGLNTD